MRTNDKQLRARKVLDIVVQTHILTGAPVSSGFVSQKLHFSSATIRNSMARLEERGLIKHPHTSAGRVPTDQGYRFYVESLMQLKSVAEDQANQIEREYYAKVQSLEDMLEKTASILSRFTNCGGISFLPKMDTGAVKYVNLVPLSRRQILVIVVAQSGFVRNYLIELDNSMERDVLQRTTNFLNKELYSIPLEEIKSQLVTRLQEERDSSHTVVRAAYEIFRNVLIEGIDELFYFDGASQLVAYPEFREQGKLEAILKVLEGKQTLLDILSDDLNEKALKIHIGSENKRYGVDELSVITAGFTLKDKSVGRLGIVGPRRIAYDRVVPIVELLSSTVTKMLSRGDEEG